MDVDDAAGLAPQTHPKQLHVARQNDGAGAGRTHQYGQPIFHRALLALSIASGGGEYRRPRSTRGYRHDWNDCGHFCDEQEDNPTLSRLGRADPWWERQDKPNALRQRS